MRDYADFFLLHIVSNRTDIECAFLRRHVLPCSVFLVYVGFSCFRTLICIKRKTLSHKGDDNCKRHSRLHFHERGIQINPVCSFHKTVHLIRAHKHSQIGRFRIRPQIICHGRFRLTAVCPLFHMNIESGALQNLGVPVLILTNGKNRGRPAGIHEFCLPVTSSMLVQMVCLPLFRPDRCRPLHKGHDQTYRYRYCQYPFPYILVHKHISLFRIILGKITIISIVDNSLSLISSYFTKALTIFSEKIFQIFSPF